MELVFTLQDIHDFLLERKKFPEWNYDVYDRRTGKKRTATIEDFLKDEIVELMFKNVYGENCSLEVKVSNFYFGTYDDWNLAICRYCKWENFSSLWIEYMLQTHGEDYAKRLLKNSARNKKRIQNEVVEKINEYAQQVKNENCGEIEYYDELARKAMTYLTDSDIVDIIETI